MYEFNIYDFHSHILPNIDDGSCSVDESLSMLRESASQGVTQIAATPHLSAERIDPEKFLELRQASWDKLSAKVDSSMPKIALGAEVKYYDCICRMDLLPALRISGTSLLLIEMPFCRWSARMLDTLLELNYMKDIRVLIAHFERYLNYQTRDTWKLLQKNGIMLQADADFFITRSTRRKAVKMFNDGNIHFLGSDCHNMSKRKPNMGDALKIIQKSANAKMQIAMEQREKSVFYE